MKRTVFVPGRAAPQGSKNARIIKKKDGTQYAALYESSKRVKPYRASVRKHLREAGVTPVRGPISLTVVFVRPAKANAPKTYTPYVTTLPDIDKQLRALLDGMTSVAYYDDGQVCQVNMAEVYPQPEFPEVGTYIIIRSGVDVPDWLGQYPPSKQPDF